MSGNYPGTEKEMGRRGERGRESEKYKWEPEFLVCRDHFLDHCTERGQGRESLGPRTES